MSSKNETVITTEQATPTLVPKLRFPEFRGTEDWTPVTLKKVSTLVTERVGNRKLTPISITAGIGFVPQAEKFGRDISGKQYQLYTLVSDGDFVYNKGNSLKFPQGCVYQLQGWGQVAAPNVFICFRLKDGYSDVFFQNCFEQNMHGKQLKKHITSGARSNGLLNISKEKFFGVEFLTPSSAEQRKIAECLSSVDVLMAAQARKVDGLKTYKKGLRQHLFLRDGETKPRIRFPEFQNAGEWKPRTLGSVCSSFSGGTPSTSNAEYYGGDIPFIRSAEISRNSTELFLTREGLVNSAAKMVTKGTVLVALYGANSGDVALAKIDGAINQAILCLKSKESNAFIYQFLSFKKDWIVATYLQGGQGNLSGEIFKSLVVAFPLPDEQHSIALCLSSLDTLIAAETQKLEAFKTQKKGLMQQLFLSPKEIET